MRLLLLNYEFPPLGGGAANATLQILKEFRRTNSETTIDVVTSSIGADRVEHFSDRITIYYVNIHKRGSLHKQSNIDLLWYSFAAYAKAKKLRAQHVYDGVHAYFGIPCGYIARKLRLPYIVSLRGSDVPFYNKKYFWLDILFFAHLSKRIWKDAVAVTSTSEGLKELALRVAPEQNIEVLRNGVYTQDFVPQERSDRPFTVISTSRLVERKGIRYLIEGFGRFHSQYPHSRLYIAGEGEDMEQLKSFSQDTNAVEAITFFGAVPHEKMLELYHESDVFVLPSMNEGMSNSLLEAMSSGLAVLATNTGDAQYLVAGGKIIPKRDSESIYSFLEYTYTHPQELEEMKKKNREYALSMGWEEVTKHTKALYARVFQSK
ncbi:MAG: glycosyltransferase family 4 protein [Candidatus Kerfeldbacteria bacterium]|nr:glycosyltransferase family 4 protein [Candidatus Kerfeldbacteria bacterium]